MATPRYNNATATLLPSGKVLLAGGQPGGSATLASAELYDPASGTWATTGSMSTPRTAHAAVLLPNGKVLAAGGYIEAPSGLTFLSSAELYDPVAGTWTPTGSMSVAHAGAISALLPNGKVLVSSGESGSAVWTAVSELYDPASGTWAPTAAIGIPRTFGTSTLLPNGKILAAGGGMNASADTATAELYDPASGIWSATGSMAMPLHGHSATLLNSGTVLVAGGYKGGFLTTNAAELYDPATGVWTFTGSMAVRRQYQAAALLANGQVLVAGGGSYNGCICTSTTNTAELYDPSAGTWSATASMSLPRSIPTGTLLPNGQFLVAGGQTDSGITPTAEIYTGPAPSGSGTGAWIAKPSMPTARHAPNVGAINGALYVAGGFNGGHITTVQAYDVASGVWSNKANMPFIQDDGGSVSGNGLLYAVGGNNCCVAVNQLSGYSPATDSWSVLAPMPSIRQAPAVAWSAGTLYAAGGANGGNLSVLEAYSAGTNSWVTKAPMPTARQGAVAAVINGILYVIGGCCNGSARFSTVEAYDPATNTWTAKSPMPTARNAAAGTVVNGILYVIGGYNGTAYVNTVEAYNPAADSWSSMASMPTARANLGADVINGIIYAVGGVNSAGELATLEAFTPPAGSAPPPNTGTGSNVAVSPAGTPTANLTFSNVMSPGLTSMSTSATGPALPSGFQLGSPALYIDLSTTATFNGAVQVCFNYSSISFNSGAQPRLLHYQSGSWTDVTASVNTASQTVCGSVTSFSPFAIVQAIDATPPVTTAVASPTPNASGWNSSAVTVGLSAVDNDGGSGVKQITYSASGAQALVNTTVLGSSASFNIGVEGSTVVSWFATDNAGNAEAPKSLTLQIDRTAPLLAASASPAPNAAGWHNTNVTVSFSCSDALSGVAACSGPTTISTEGANQAVTGAATDKAGNTATASLSVSIDKTLPTATYSGNAGSYTVDQSVSINCAVADPANGNGTPGSGIASTTCQNVSGAAYAFTVGANSVSATATDKAGNIGSGSTSFTVVVNVPGLSNLIGQFVNDAPVASSMQDQVASIGSAPNANAKAGKLKAFTNLVNAQTGKALTSGQAAILIRLAGYL